MTTNHRGDSSLDELFQRFRVSQDLDALGALFDRAAPRLLGLARQLAGRRSEAEDWVQQTFLTALEKPASFPEGESVMPWLLGILVNHARADRRKTGRVPEVDRLTDRQAEPPDARLGAAELHDAIEAAVAELPPAQRQVVAGRLLNGESNAELGRALDLAPNTVRARLHRGLRRLRAVLPASLATGLFAWLSPRQRLGAVRQRLLEQAAGPTGVGTVAKAATGSASIAAKKLAAGAAGAGLAALLGVALFEALTPPPSGTEGLPPAAQLARAEPGIPSAPAARALSTTRANVAAAPAPAFVIATVLAEDGQPVPGQTVVLNLGRRSTQTSREAVTNKSGEARFELEPGAYVASLQIPITPTRPLIRTTCYSSIPAGETKQFTLQLEPGFSIAGHVVDEDGRRIAGAEVLGYCDSSGPNEPSRRVLTGDDGSFRLDHLGPSVRALARYESMACLRGLRGTPEEGFTAEGLELVMAPAIETRGQVFLPDGRPAAGARVSVSDGMNSRSASDATHIPGLLTYRATSAADITGASGAFILKGLTRGPVSPNVLLKPYLEKAHPAEAGAQDLRITLDAGKSISGQVFLPSGAPAAGAAVQWGPHYTNRHHAPSTTTTDALGRYSLHGLSDESSPPWVGVSHAGYALAHLQPITIGEAQPDIHLTPEQRVAGVVVDGSGRPLADLRVVCLGTPELSMAWISGRNMSLGYAFDLDQVQTDESGAFRFERLLPGPYELQVFPRGQRRRHIALQTTGGQEDLRIEVSPTTLARVVIRGRVTDGATGDPVSKFTVTAHASRENSTSKIGYPIEVTDDDGRYSVDGLAPGETQITVTAAGYARAMSTPRPLGLGEHEYDFTLYPARSLTVAVVHPSGKPIQGARLRFKDANLSWRVLDGWSRGTTTVPQAGLTLAGLPAKPVTLHVSGKDSHREVSVDLTAAKDHRIEVQIQEPARGRVGIWILEANSHNQAPRWRTELETAMVEGDRAWIQAAVESGAIATPHHQLSLLLTPTDSSRSTRLEAKLSPGEGDAGRGVDIEQSVRTSSGSSTVQAQLPFCAVEESLPAGTYTLRVDSKPYAPLEEEVEIRAGSSLAKVLILHPR